jgi:hypothetical protein
MAMKPTSTKPALATVPGTALSNGTKTNSVEESLSSQKTDFVTRQKIVADLSEKKKSGFSPGPRRSAAGSRTLQTEGLLDNLLSLANSGKPLRGSRKQTSDVRTHKPDVWTNRSVVLENISRTESKTSSSEEPELLDNAASTSQNLDAPEPVHSYGDISLLPLLKSVPCEKSKIAFKVLQISANYTPGSNYISLKEEWGVEM